MIRGIKCGETVHSIRVCRPGPGGWIGAVISRSAQDHFSTTTAMSVADCSSEIILSSVFFFLIQTDLEILLLLPFFPTCLEIMSPPSFADQLPRQSHNTGPSSFPQIRSAVNPKLSDFQENVEKWRAILSAHESALDIASSESRSAASIHKHTLRQLLGKLRKHVYT